MLNRFSRTELLVGNEAMEKLKIHVWQFSASEVSEDTLLKR